MRAWTAGIEFRKIESKTLGSLVWPKRDPIWCRPNGRNWHLQTSVFELFNCVITSPGGEGHVENGRALVAGTGHAGAIGDEHVFTMVQLVPLVEQ
jgi:hypothetical protein